MIHHRIAPTIQYTLPSRKLLIPRKLCARAVLTLVAAALLTQPAMAAPPRQAPNSQPQFATANTHGVYLPQLVNGEADDSPTGCPATSSAVFNSVPVVGPPTDRPPRLHADLNLSRRSYTQTSRSLTLVDINGQADPDAPQLAGVANAAARLDFSGVFQVNDWDWACEEEHGCRGEPISAPPVTLLSLATQRGAPVRTPARNAEIHAGGYVALVLYAETRRITLAYTREDTAAFGYVVHIEDVCVDPTLLALYRQQNAAGRSRLPALHSLQQLGTGSDSPIKIAIRDTGSFMDPRSRKDWWKGY